jgi:4-diphosphocytidyl-2-C-methyl-D-erythritol kinase
MTAIISTQRTVITSPAKINLYLHVIGKRDDGYHDLDSLVAFAHYGDEISISQSSTPIFSKDGAFAHVIPNDQNNAIKKAWRGLELYTGRDLPCHIHITKNIPAGAGLGGGSSNAASVLHGLIDHFQLQIDYNDIMDMALSIGSDVPVCFHQSPTIMRGRGGDCTPAPTFPTIPMVIIWPHITHPTGDIYARLSGAYSAPVTVPEYFYDAHDLTNFLKTSTQNDLENPAFQLSPQLADMIKYLSSQKRALFTRMTGSGSAFFALFETTNDAQNALTSFQKKFPNMWGISTFCLGA